MEKEICHPLLFPPVGWDGFSSGGLGKFMAECLRKSMLLIHPPVSKPGEPPPRNCQIIGRPPFRGDRAYGPGCQPGGAFEPPESNPHLNGYLDASGLPESPLPPSVFKGLADLSKFSPLQTGGLGCKPNSPGRRDLQEGEPQSGQLREPNFVSSKIPGLNPSSRETRGRPFLFLF